MIKDIKLKLIKYSYFVMIGFLLMLFLPNDKGIPILGFDSIDYLLINVFKINFIDVLYFVEILNNSVALFGLVIFIYGVINLFRCILSLDK